MFTMEEYVWAWGIYAVAGCVVLLSLWFLTASWRPFELKWLARIIPAVLVCVPWPISADSTYFAPAWFASGADFLTSGQNAFWRAGLALVIALGVSVFLAIIIFIWRRVKRA